VKVTAFDTETHLIKPGLLTPKLVCSTWASDDGSAPLILSREDTLAKLKYEINNSILVGHNLVFDLGVATAQWPELLPDVFSALERGTLSDTMLRQKIIDNAAGQLGRLGKYSLQVLAERLLGEHVEKEDTYRLRYHELDGVPLEAWPQEALDYAINDARVTLAVWKEQSPERLREELTEQRADWALHLCSITGLRTDPEAVEDLEEQLEEQLEEYNEIALRYKFVREKGGKLVRDTKLIKQVVAASYPSKNGPPKTPTGAVKADREVLQKCTHEGLRMLAERSGVEKLLKTYIPVLQQGTRFPVTPGYDTIKDTFRTSSFRPNIQNLPRKGGVRECFAARDDYVYVFCDYDTLELRSLAQVNILLGHKSAMAQALWEGKDLHLLAAAQLLNTTYKQAKQRYQEGDPKAEEARHIAKCLNFGLPGGMGAQRFVDYCSMMGVSISEDRAKYLKGLYLSLYPEMRDYFRWCSNLVQDGPATLEFIGTGYKRGMVHYTAAANGNFQHLAAMGAKNSLYLTARRCFVEESDLNGSRPMLFLHDEIGIEAPENQAAAAADELEATMIDGMKKYITDVPVTCGPVMMRRWYKGAKPVRRDGKLVPCRPAKKQGRTVWVED